MYYKMIDSVYFFNDKNFIVSCYGINKNGFIYSVTKHDEKDFYSMLAIISCSRVSVKLTDDEFLQFCGHLDAIQENANSLTPITDFGSHIDILVKRYKIDLKVY